MKILLLGEDRIRLEPVPGPLTIEAESPDSYYSPFHMLGSSMAVCVLSVLHSWAHTAKLQADDLVIEVGWEFAENPYRVGSFDLELHWPSLPEQRRPAAERVAHTCTVHQTLLNPPKIETRVTGA